MRSICLFTSHLALICQIILLRNRGTIRVCVCVCVCVCKRRANLLQSNAELMP